MDEALLNVSNAAVWGSLIANVVLGAFMLVQAVVDRLRRVRFGAFAAVCLGIAAIDWARPKLDPMDYEMLRLLAWCGYGVGVVHLLGAPWRIFAAVSVGLPGLGLSVWFSGYPALATTVTFPVVFSVAAVAHGLEHRRHQGYSSAILCASSLAMGLMCLLFLPVIHRAAAEPQLPVLGYAHFASFSLLAVFLGWVHIPRELRGRSPVRVPPSHAVLLIGAVLATEGVVQLGLIVFFGHPPLLYLAGCVAQAAAMLLLFFRHRHLLVIHADNVSALLDERTASLRVAQEQLSALNESQARKLTEQERELKARAEVIERQRRLELAAQTTGQAAHDIQNLITPILSQVGRLEQRQESLDGIQDVAGSIRRQVEHLLDLNSQMLALSRRGRLDFQPVNVGDLVREIPSRFPGRPVTVLPSGETWIQGSWSQILRAVSNLVLNAVEAQPNPASVTTLRTAFEEIVEHRRCHLGFLAPGRYVRISVEDLGPGIPESVIDRIFEPFYSSKDGRSRSGSGLGLTIVAAVADDHRAVVDLRTGPGGTEFMMYFPAIAPPVAMDSPEQLNGSETVLVADDDSSVLETYGGILEQAGYRVLKALSGVEALNLLQTETVDLMLLDLKMPRLTGLDTFFGAMHLRPGIRAIVHSSYLTDEESTRLRELGVSAILLKPAGRLEILRTVRQVLDEHSPLRA